MLARLRRDLRRRTPASGSVHVRSREVLAQESVPAAQAAGLVYFREARGCRLVDVDGREYVDLGMGFGTHVLGHGPHVATDAVRHALDRGLQWGGRNPYQERLARVLVEAAPCAERVVFCTSGTEALMYAVRAARAYTGKPEVALVDGGYHGAYDGVLVGTAAGSRPARPRPAPRGAGLPRWLLRDVRLLPYDDPEAFAMIRRHRRTLAAVLVEPVQNLNPTLDGGPFLDGLRVACRDAGVLMVMDEVITGFRLAHGGGQELFGVVPDLAVYGKALGGGLPIGAVAGRADVMEVFAWRAEPGARPPRVFAGGSFAGNALGMVAGHAAVSYLREHPEVYKNLAEQGRRLAAEVNAFCAAERMPAQLQHALSMFRLRLSREPVRTAHDGDARLWAAEDAVCLRLLARGVVLPGIRLGFLSAAHAAEDVDAVIEAFRASLLDVRNVGLL